MDAMSEFDPTPRATSVDPDVLGTVAWLVREATRLANQATGTDLRSPWLDVVAQTVTAAGYLSDVPDAPTLDGDPSLPVGARALLALERAAHTLDGAHGRRDHRVVLVRAALTDAITIAARIRT